MRQGCTFVLLCILLQACSGSAPSPQKAIVHAVEMAAPAVVSVNVDLSRITVNENLRDPDFWRFFELYRQKKHDEPDIRSIGSGFIFDAEGYILTNYHVVEGMENALSVILPDARRFAAVVAGTDPRTDLAILKIHGTDLPVIPLGDATKLQIGEWVIAIGNPLGTMMDDPNPSVCVGVVSALNRRLSADVAKGDCLYDSMIQTDAAINPGNSGGPLVNERGEVVGINTMIFSPGGGSIGLGFAIPFNRAQRVADELKQGQKRRDPWAGFKVEDVAALRSDFLDERGIVARSGCLIVEIIKACPAYDAGLRTGDVIVEADGRAINSVRDLDFVMWDHFIGDTVSMKVDRNGQLREVQFKLAAIQKP